VDARTMEIHHTKHHQAYVNNLNAALAGTADENASLEDLMSRISLINKSIEVLHPGNTSGYNQKNTEYNIKDFNFRFLYFHIAYYFNC
jgi:Fe-Mn family superoxide dismutase